MFAEFLKEIDALARKLEAEAARKRPRQALAAIAALRDARIAKERLDLDEAGVRFSLADETERPIALLSAIAPSSPSYPAAQELLAHIFRATNAPEEALEAARRAVAADPVRGLGGYAVIVDYETDRLETRVAELADLLARHDALPPFRRGLALNALGRLHHKLGDFDSAYHAFDAAKTATAPPFSVEAERAAMDALRARFTRDRVATRPAVGSDDERPVFIVGLPRSGSTLLENVIAAHPEAAAAGETLEFGKTLHRLTMIVARRAGGGAARHLAKTLEAAPDGLLRRATNAYLATLSSRALSSRAHVDARRVTDKTLTNFKHVGAIRMLLPNARILNARRDYRDVYVSCLMQHFADPVPYAHHQLYFAYYAVLYDQLMDFWRAEFPEAVADVDYAALVADPQAEGTAALDHIGLDWREACATPHESLGLVRTASAAQVARPINRDGLARWKPYEKHIAPLLDVLERYEAAKRAAAA